MGTSRQASNILSLAMSLIQQGGILFLFLVVGTVSGMDPGGWLWEPAPNIQEQVEAPRQENMERQAGVPWEEVCNTTLFFSEDSKSWDDAKGFCEQIGGNLVEIRSMFMNYCILHHVYHKGLPEAGYWHSGNDIDDEGVYRYNRAADFSLHPGDLILWTPLWVNNEPDGGRGQNCLYVSLTSNSWAGKWWNAGCTADHPYICQRKL